MGVGQWRLLQPGPGRQYIFLMDDHGTTVIIKPGRKYEKVAVNTIENYAQALDYPYAQDKTYSTPIFEGSRMYYRSGSYIYCVGEKRVLLATIA